MGHPWEPNYANDRVYLCAAGDTTYHFGFISVCEKLLIGHSGAQAYSGFLFLFMVFHYSSVKLLHLIGQICTARPALVAALLLGQTMAVRAQAPVNDDCTQALLLTVSITCTTTVVNTTQATASPASLPASTCSISNTPDVWYRVVVPSSGGLTVGTSAAVGSVTTSSILDAYLGTCSNLVPLACDRATNQSGTPAFSSLALRNLMPGSIVYIRPRVNNTVVGMTGIFNLCVEEVHVTANQAALADGLLSLWPNPAQHRTNLTLPALPGQATATVEILSSLGQMVRRQIVTLTSNGTTVALDLVDLPTGIYAVWTRAGKASATVRMLID